MSRLNSGIGPGNDHKTCSIGCMVVGPISKITGAGACAGSTARIGRIGAGINVVAALIMAGGAMVGTIGMRWLTIGAAIGGSTIGVVAV